MSTALEFRLGTKLWTVVQFNKSTQKLCTICGGKRSVTLISASGAKVLTSCMYCPQSKYAAVATTVEVVVLTSTVVTAYASMIEGNDVEETVSYTVTMLDKKLRSKLGVPLHLRRIPRELFLTKEASVRASRRR